MIVVRFIYYIMSIELQQEDMTFVSFFKSIHIDPSLEKLTISGWFIWEPCHILMM